jgi:hypothetical protein
MQNSHYLKKISNPSTLSLKGKRERSVSRNKDDKITALEHELAMLNDQYQETLTMYTTRKSRKIDDRQSMETKLKEILKSMEIKASTLSPHLLKQQSFFQLTCGSRVNNCLHLQV